MCHNRNANRLIFCIICSLFFKTVGAQIVSANDLVKITAAADSFRNSHPVEKLYVQFDKPYYTPGDTIWFKAYLFNASFLGPSKNSGILYIELANDSNKVIKRMMLPVANGLSWGDIALDAKEITQGSYVLRAYTNWMRNFGENYIFKKGFYFGSTTGDSWLVNTRLNLVKGKGADTARLTLQFNQVNREPLILKDINLDVLDGKNIWYKSKLQTKTDGRIDISFALKTAAKHLTIITKEINKANENHKLIIPITLNRPEDIDLQFMPEGGNLVAGLPASIGFKAIDADGKGVAVQGNIYDSKQQVVASFKSAHGGMGAFDLIPQANETYTAKVTLAGSSVKTYSLPPVKNIGTVLKIRTVKAGDSLAITVMATQANGSYYLVGQSRGIVCYGAVVNLVNNAIKSKISTAVFPTGIARFTLLNAARLPLNERAVFINHHDNLQIDMKPGKAFYNSRDSIALKLHVTDKDGNPVKGKFSLSVTDGNQVKIDSTANMVTNLLLTSDLKGDIEGPDYYFRPDQDDDIRQQLDNLLLTQGWVGYDWKEILNPTKPILYPSEQDFTIRGKVKNLFSKPVAGTHVTLFSKKPTFVMDSVTNKDGGFIFKGIVPLDTPVYLIQARNKNGKSFNVGAGVEEFKPPVFTEPTKNIAPWYVNSDTVLMNYTKNKISAKERWDRIGSGGGHVLKEVVISAKKIIKGSQNLNGPGNADLVIDEEELEKAGKKTFLQLLQEKIPGFKVGFMLLSGPSKKAEKNQQLGSFIIDGGEIYGPAGSNQYWYYINNKPVKFIIDGISLYKIITMSPPALTNINDYLNSHSAEDIKGIEVNSSTKYASKYVPMEWAFTVAPSDVAFVEITTRSGGGPGISNTPGTYLYKPMPFSLPKQFYEPKYTLKNRSIAAKDYRSTIYWEPDIVTDKDGNATVSFYAADSKGAYNVIFEGTDWNGNIGSSRMKINVTGK
jgi:hypothetical protein